MLNLLILRKQVLNLRSFLREKRRNCMFLRAGKMGKRKMTLSRTQWSNFQSKKKVRPEKDQKNDFLL